MDSADLGEPVWSPQGEAIPTVPSRSLTRSPPLESDSLLSVRAPIPPLPGGFPRCGGGTNGDARPGRDGRIEEVADPLLGRTPGSPTPSHLHRSQETRALRTDTGHTDFTGSRALLHLLFRPGHGELRTRNRRGLRRGGVSSGDCTGSGVDTGSFRPKTHSIRRRPLLPSVGRDTPTPPTRSGCGTRQGRPCTRPENLFVGNVYETPTVTPQYRV